MDTDANRPKAQGVTLWMLNDKLNADEIRRQLQGIRDAGIGAVITRTYNGLQTKYLSDEYMEILEVAVESARDLGLDVFFQAGYMPAGIPDLPREYQHIALALADEAADDQQVVGEIGGKVVVKKRMPNILDMLNPAAVKHYLQTAYEDVWFARFGNEFGKTIKSVWVDEPHFKPGNLPWGEPLIERFKATWGYSVEDHIPPLFGHGAAADRVRHHYWRTVVSLLNDAYFREISRWCEKHNVIFSGHLMGEDSLANQIGSTGACMPLYEHMHLPGIDHLTLSLNWPYHREVHGCNLERRFILTPKQCSSAAHQFGRSKVLAEMYGVSTTGITFEDRKAIADWFAALGINERCLHGSFYSMRGRRKKIYPPTLSYQQPWWEQNRLISDYCSQTSIDMRKGMFGADILVLHSVESAFMCYTPGDSPDHERINRLEDSIQNLSDDLVSIQRDYDYGDETIMAKLGCVDGNRIVVGAMRYKTVVLPSMITLRRSTFELLKQFVANGGTIIAAGETPICIDAVESRDLQDFMAQLPKIKGREELRAALLCACPPAHSVQVTAGPAQDLLLHTRILDDGQHRLFLTNASRSETIRASVDGAELVFAPADSKFIDPPGLVSEAAATFRDSVDIPSAWTIERSAPNALTLDFCRYRRADGEHSSRLPVSAIKQILSEDEPYEGPITIRFDFDISFDPDSLGFVLEDAADWTITVNGQAVESTTDDWYCDRSFGVVEIGPAVSQGTNCIEISRDFEKLRTASGLIRLFSTSTGVEIENAYLIGDFAVEAAVSGNRQRPQSLRYQPDFRLVEPRSETNGDLIADGLPFFCGTLTLRNEVELTKPSNGGRLILRLPGLETCTCTVTVNGQELGAIAWQPFRINITDAVQDGTNRIELELTNTMRNLIGPHHRPLVEQEHCWGETAWSGRWCKVTGQGYPQWYYKREKETDAWTEDYYFVRFGLYEAAVLGIE